jgi:predicted HAD superfamily hydrolase
MPFEYDLYVSVASVKGINVCRKAFSGLSMQRRLIIERVPNQGRDIAPMFCAFGSRLKNYSYIAHLHSKKSLYNNGATEGWREYLCSNLLGSESRIRRIFALMQGEAPCGIVYPQNYSLLPLQANTWLANKALGATWCARLGINKFPQGYFDFPAGSMFWVKGNALKPLFDTGITLGDFAEEAGQTDGTFAHCLERLLVLSSLRQGYKPGIIKDLQNPAWNAWNFHQFTWRTFQSMVNQLFDPAIKLIAFDIFDTLLCRPLMDAESVKAIVAERIGGTAGQLYLQYRSIAESQARESAGKDIGMSEIFAQLAKLAALSDEELAQMRGMEEKIEYATVKARPQVVELYQQALLTGKPVVLISDMFLPRAVIEASLQTNGICGWNKLFLSNEIGLRKDTGELYEYVFSKYGIIPNEMLMVGDNERSDLQIPADKGVVCIHLLKPLEFARGLPRFRSVVEKNEGNSDLNQELTLGLILQNTFSAICYPQFDPSSLVFPTPFNLGYSLIGPLLVGFSQWLLEKADSDGIDRLYFLAREGQLIKLVYDLWSEGIENSPQTDYLILSRRSVIVPMIQNIEDILKIAKVTYYPNTISSFLFERYGLELSTERWAQLSEQVQWGSNNTVEVYNQNIDHLLQLLDELASEIIAIAGTEYNAMKYYLNNMGLEDSGCQAVVDVGYSATIQNYLNRIVTTSVHGYYLITDQRSVEVSEMHEVIVRGCYLENVQPDDTSPLIYQRSFDLEKFLSSNDAQIIHYELDKDNHLTAHHRELSNSEIECFNFRSVLREGIISYVQDARNIRERILPSYQPSLEIAKQLYEAFIEQQSQLEKDFLQKVVLDDYYCGRGLVR